MLHLSSAADVRQFWSRLACVALLFVASLVVPQSLELVTLVALTGAVAIATIRLVTL